MKNVDLKRMQKLAGLLKEEKQSINEALSPKELDRAAIRVFGYAGIKTKYDSSLANRVYGGQEAVDRAVELAPKLIKFEKDVEDSIKKIKNSPVVDIYAEVVKEYNAYGGSKNTGDSFLNVIAHILKGLNK
jgi:hypothetical protein